MRPATLCRAIALVPLSRHRRANVRAYTWAVEQVPPRRSDPDDLPGFVLTAIENIHPELSMARAWAMGDSCLAAARSNPALVPEFLAFAARDSGDRSDRDGTLKTLAPELLGHPDLAREARRRAEALTNPYHRGRAMLRLLPSFAADAGAIRTAALADARAVADPFRRSQVYERLLAATPAALSGETGGGSVGGGPRARTTGLASWPRRAAPRSQSPTRTTGRVR